MTTARRTGSARLDGRIEQFRVLVLRRIAVRVDDEVIVAVVCGLQGSPGLHVEEVSHAHVVPRRRITEVHRKRPGENDEGLFLLTVPMPLSLRAGLVAPDVAAGVPEAGEITQLR